MSTQVEQSGLDFGIPDDDLALNIAYVDNQIVVLDNDEIQNPFCVSIEYSSTTDNSVLGKGYRNVLVLCMNESYAGEEEAQEILYPVIKKNTLERIGKHFCVVSVSKAVLYAHTNSKAVVVSKEHLVHFSQDDLSKLNQNEVVIMMLELRRSAVEMYANLFGSRTDVKNMGTLLTLANCYNGQYKQPVENHLYEYMKNVREANFWTNKKNCNFTMSDNFIKRQFQYKELQGKHLRASVISKLRQSQDADITKVIDKLQNFNEVNENLLETDYLKNIYRKEEYTDVANALKDSAHRTFFATNEQQLEITKEDVTRMFEFTKDEKELFNLFNTFVTSKDLCHFVLNNPVVLDKMKPLFDKYLPFYRYVFGTAWITLYSEECIFKTKSTVANRYVFKIGTANKLPVFPVCPEDLHLNPYIALLVSDKLLDAKNNCLSLPTIANYQNYGIGSLDDFKRKFNIFTTGTSTKNILDGLDWANFAVSGSVMTACVPKRSPLMDVVVDTATNEISQYMTYFNHYYNESDIDLMCNDPSIFKFMDKVIGLIRNVSINLKELKGDEAVNTLVVEPIKTLALVVHYKYLEHQLEEIREYVGEQWSVEEVLKNIDSSEVKEYFYEIYTKNKFKSNRTNRKIYHDKQHTLYNDYYRVSSIDDMNIYVVEYEINKDTYVEHDSDHCVYLSDIVTDKSKVQENIMVMKISEGIKFKLKSTEMLHSIEVFRVRDNDFFATVGRFHLPCVRAFYDGSDVHLLPSCITAMLTGFNIDYKYFAGIRDPIDILNKYRMRGYSIIINDKEKQHMVYYNGAVNKWNGMFAVDTKKKESITSLFGSKKLTDEIYKPAKYLKGFPDDAYRKVDSPYIQTVADLQSWYNERYPVFAKTGLNLMDFKTINSEGYINPLKTWLFDAVQDWIN